MTDRDSWEAAWWSAVSEPADPCARIVRVSLGERAGREWLQGTWGPLPEELAAYSHIDWFQQWNRWRERALATDIDLDLARVERSGGGFIVPGDARWPEQFSCLGEDEPLGLWYLGELPQDGHAETCMSIVGARASTGAGQRCARNMAYYAASVGYCIVSGGAIGIDIEAHRGSLAARGCTICVLAGGVSNPYPACHSSDLRAILEGGGALVSEVPPTARPAKWRFLNRNRLIAAWSVATVVVEAGVRSGALATARWAMSCGRKLGAVPGSVDAPMSAGCLELARNGATIVRDGRDAVELAGPISIDGNVPLFGMPVEQDRGVSALEPIQRRVWESLPRRSPATVSAICVSAGLGREEVNRALMDLSVAGLVVGSTRGWCRAHGREDLGS